MSKHIPYTVLYTFSDAHCSVPQRLKILGELSDEIAEHFNALHKKLSKDDDLDEPTKHQSLILNR